MARFAAPLAAFFIGLITPFATCNNHKPSPKPTGQLRNFAELGAALSSSASILFPNDQLFASATLRWQAYSAPSFRAVVEAATEGDIQKAVLFARQHSIPFLATGGAHGFAPSLGRLKNGLEIRTRSMKSIEIYGDYARMGPGLTNGELVRALWAKNKRTVTGSCMCSGMMGVTLGGGHGIIQGEYGLAADQLLEARVVLADGSAITVSPNSHSDLFWALKGAGHNFGVLSELKFKIHPRGSLWSWNEMLFKGNKVEQFFTEANKFTEESYHPPNLMHFMQYRRRRDIDPDNTIISSTLMFEGAKEELEKFAAPFRKLGPVAEQVAASVQYPDIFKLNQQLETDPLCIPNLQHHLMPIRLHRFNLTAQRQVYNFFNDLSKDPGLNSTLFLFEGYPRQGVVAVPEERTAVPFRREQLLCSSVFAYSDISLQAKAITAGKKMRNILLDGSGSNDLHAYVNYAFSDESLQALYGYEPWRIARLEKLKRKYDPDGAFSFYHPIPVA